VTGPYLVKVGHLRAPLLRGGGRENKDPAPCASDQFWAAATAGRNNKEFQDFAFTAGARGGVAPGGGEWGVEWKQPPAPGPGRAVTKSTTLDTG